MGRMMTDVERYYAVLELKPGATQEEVKLAYRDMAQVWHPDRFANSPRLQQKALEKMKAINEAYEFLKSYTPTSSAHSSRTQTPPRQSESTARPAQRPTERPRTSNRQLSDEIWCLRGHTALVSSVAYAPSSRTLLSGSYDKTVRVWNAGTGLEKQWFLGHKGAVTAVVFGSDGRTILSGSMDKTLFLRDAETRKERQFIYAGAVVQSVDLSGDGRYALSGTIGEGVQLWDVGTGREMRRFVISGFVNKVAFDTKAERVVAGSADGEVVVFDRRDGRRLAELRVMRNGLGQMVESLQLSRDGSYILTGSPKQLQIWQTSTGREAGRIETGVEGLSSAALSADGAYIVTGHSDATVRLWNLPQGREVYVYRGHTEPVKTVAYAPNGETVLSGSFDKTLRLWRIPNGI